jgi:beta-1,3-galactosyltransferase 1
MKCDDDSFVNVPNLIHILLGGTVPIYEGTFYFIYDKKYAIKNQNRVNSSTHLILGRQVSNSRLNRNPRIQWYVPRYMMSNEVFPNYVSGIGYVLAYESVKVLYEKSLDTPILYLEDAYMTGVVAELAQIPRRGHPLFYWDRLDKCSMHGMVCLHHYKSKHMSETFNFIVKPPVKCKLKKI